MIVELLDVRARSTRVTANAPAVFCCWRKLVRSSSYQLAVVPITVPLASTVVPLASFVLNVTSVSLQVVLVELNTWNCTLGDDVLSSRPLRRNTADATSVTCDRSKRK